MVVVSPEEISPLSVRTVVNFGGMLIGSVVMPSWPFIDVKKMEQHSIAQYSDVSVDGWIMVTVQGGQ